MNTENPRARGLHHLQPSDPVMDQWEKIGLIEPDLALVRQYASELDDFIYFYHQKFNSWVQSFGGKSYSEITTISQHMLLKLLGTTSNEDREKFSSTAFPKLAHLTWRIVSAIDDFADRQSTNAADLEILTDSEGTKVADMIKEITRIPNSDKAGLWFIKQTLIYIEKHEIAVLTFEEAKGAKEKTTGIFTQAVTLGAWPFLMVNFPRQMSRFPIKKFVQHSISGSLIAQCLDDIADFRNDLGNSDSSSLLISAAGKAGEKDILMDMLKTGIPITIAELIKRKLYTPIIFTEYFQSLLNKMPQAPSVHFLQM